MSSIKDKVLKVIQEIFTAVQFNVTCHQNYVKKLTKIYNTSNLEDFTNSFISCLIVPLCVGDRHPHVENVLSFAAKFSVSLHAFNESDGESDDEMCPFLVKLFEFLLEKHEAKSPAARFRICHFLNMLLNSMGDSAFIDDTLCDKILAAMMDRIMDRSPKVRAQAVYALHRLQDPADNECPVIQVYIFHMTKDPSAQVRRAVLNTIGKNQRTLHAVFKRIRDVNEGVRKAAYIFISKITIRSLTIKERETLLQYGLNDEEEIVRNVVRKKVLPSWLQYLQGDYMKLLRALDAETATKTAILTLEALSTQTSNNDLFQQLPLDPETKLIPINNLTAENVLFWRFFVQRLHKESCIELLEDCLPELIKFCEYIRDYQTLMKSKEYSPIEISLHQFILTQLFELAKTYDLSDEVGRSNLIQLIQDTLMSENCTAKTIELIVEYYETVVPDVTNRLNSLAHVISEIRIPSKPASIIIEQLSDDEQHDRQMKCQRLKMKLIEKQNEMYDVIQKQEFLEAQKLKAEIYELEIQIKNCVINPQIIQDEEPIEEKSDAETMIKCLSILCGMVQMRTVKSLTPTLRSLFDNMAWPSLQHPDYSVKLLAFKVVGVYLVLDKDMAKKHFMFYFAQLLQDDHDIWVISISVMFDLLLRYGLDYFDVISNGNENINEESRKNKNVRLYNNTDTIITDESLISENNDHSNNIIKIFIGLLDHGNQEIRTLATQGFVKLVLHGKLSSVHLVSRLIILFFNPVSEDDHELRQFLIIFFNNYGTLVCNSHEILEGAFLPTLRAIINAPAESPLQEIKPINVARFILDLTSVEHHKPGKEDYTVHHNLAFAILAEALLPNSDIDQDTLIKSLKYIKINCDENQMKRDMLEAISKISTKLEHASRSDRTCIEQFRRKVMGACEENTQVEKKTNAPESQNEEDDDDSS